MKKVEVVLRNEEGLHARPASIFTKVAQKYKSDIVMYKNDDTSKEYNPKSILSILSMGAAKGDKITITAEEEAAEELKHLIESNFNE